MNLILSIFLITSICNAETQSPVEMMKREELNNTGKTFISRMSMNIDPEGNSRTLEVANWIQGYDKSLLKIIKPEKDKNQGNLKILHQLWQFLPKVDRIIKIPQSMMLQSWMGSDFTNDDLVKGSQLSVDYQLKLIKTTEVNQIKVNVIEAIPKANAPVVWGKIVEYVTQKESAFVKREFYSEKLKLVKTMVGTEIKTINGHTIPTILTMTNHEKGNRKTIIQYRNIVFDQSIPESIFTQENLRKPVF